MEKHRNSMKPTLIHIGYFVDYEKAFDRVCYIDKFFGKFYWNVGCRSMYSEQYKACTGIKVKAESLKNKQINHIKACDKEVHFVLCYLT